MFDINQFKTSGQNKTRYLRRLAQLRAGYIQTHCIEQAVDAAVENIYKKQVSSFVIYGEPQSGKTEMMIALTARLLDEGQKVIVILLNDNVSLLNQNLDRFRRSGIDPTPTNFDEILDPSIKIGDKEWVIFCKKNASNLTKLIEKIKQVKTKIVVDDEADYATPNPKVNKGEQTRINKLVEELLAEKGIYIGVTATPARLDLNKTFENNNEQWVYFPPHNDYTGQDVFFPTSLANKGRYRLNLLPDHRDNPSYLREALFRFVVNVAYLNLKINNPPKNYCMLVHTSGVMTDHSMDYKTVVDVFGSLRDAVGKDYERHVKRIWEIASEQYKGNEKEITQYVIDNAGKHVPIIMNSRRDSKIVDHETLASPPALFTIIIGGNIISRGVTINNLLSMFFTRDTKHKIQQDTYIQRARMFGSRGAYLQYFELSIPESLFLTWHKCFIFHRLSLSAIQAGKGPPVWLEEGRVSSVSASSIDKSAVAMDSGEMCYDMFDYQTQIDDIVNNSSKDSLERLKEISSILGDDRLPAYLIEFIKCFLPSGLRSIAIHHTRLVGKETSYHDTLERPRGFFGKQDTDRFPEAHHHIMIHQNTYGKARVVYNYTGHIKTIKRIQQIGV